ERLQLICAPERSETPDLLPPDGLAALAIPILVPPAPPAVIAMSWRERFLLTPTEHRTLRMLSALATVAWARLAARRRQEGTHLASTEAISKLPWFEESRPEGTPLGADPMLNRILKAYLHYPGLVELWARASSSSRSQPPWTGLGPTGEPTLTQVERDVASTAVGAGPRPIGAGRWVITEPIGPDHRPIGSLVAVFKTRPAASEGRGDLTRLSADLALALQLLRRSTDNASLVELSRALADSTEPHQALDRIAAVIRRQMSADGVKVFILTTTSKQPRIELLHQTDMHGPAPKSCRLSKSRGLADWVIKQEDWLLVTDERQDGAPNKPPVTATTGRHGARKLAPRAAEEYWGQPAEAGERTRLMVPLVRQGRITGVLEVWRQTAEPFDSDLDIETMRHFAPHVIATCVRIRGMQRMSAELAAISRLADASKPEQRPAQVRQRLLDEVGGLSGAPRAVLFLHDGMGRLLSVARWSRATKHSLPVTFRSLNVHAGLDPMRWADRLRESLSLLLSGDPPVQVTLIRAAPDAPARGAVALLWLPGQTPETTFTPQIDQQTLASLLSYGSVLLDNHVRAYVHALVDQVNKERDWTLSRLFNASARLVRQATGADLVLIYQRTLHTQTVRSVLPASPSVRDLVTPGGALTRKSETEQAVIAIRDIQDSTDPHNTTLNRAPLEEVARKLGWPGLRSWVCAPIVAQGRTLGLIKAMTSSRGPFLDPDLEAVIAAVAAWTAGEAEAAIRREMLEDLNAAAHQLAGRSGKELGSQSLKKLSDWISRYLYRRCSLLIFARTGQEHVLLQAASAQVSGATIELLSRLSLSWGTDSPRWASDTRHPLSDDTSIHLAPAGMACALRLPGQPALRGHLIALHREPFTEADQAILSEGARELSTLMYGEQVLHESRFQSGLFRHALLGPVQGLTSAALRVAMLAEEAGGKSEELETLQLRILEETEVIRLWRDTQRTFAMLQDNTQLDLRVKERPLRPLVERCLARYRPAFDARGITTTLHWPPGELRFRFDRIGVDLALSNLLDNARKYAFYNRSVAVGAEVTGSWIRLWVEDVGTSVPRDLGQSIYDLQKRTGQSDPLRAIQGEGIGLYISSAVATAHGGRLYHSSQPEGSRT
ncbi:MAG: signal transduction histidine kinase, partial [Myxococcota bacterium]